MSLSTGDTNVYDIRGDVYMELGEYESAISDYEKAISMDKKFESVSGPKIEWAKKLLYTK